MRVVIAPDSFKGSAAARDVATAVALGWLDARPHDEVVLLPLADGGEGTLDAVVAATPGAVVERVPVDGPAGRAQAPWARTPDGTAVVELAAACGLPLWPEPDPLGAHTFALGQVLRAAAEDPRTRCIVVALGGSASTDGGTGALAALGAAFHTAGGMPLGVLTLERLVGVELGGLVPPPAGGVEVLVDVDVPLLGPSGAAAQFGPQKGAGPAEVARLERALTRLTSHLGGDPDAPGAGAAGGTAYGLTAGWGAVLTSGSAAVARLAGLAAALDDADLVITGEGRLDTQSLQGKVVGHVARVAAERWVPVTAVVGQTLIGAQDAGLAGIVSLTELAGSAQRAQSEVRRWLREAGRVAASAHVPAS